MGVLYLREMHPCNSSEGWLSEQSLRMEDRHPQVFVFLEWSLNPAGDNSGMDNRAHSACSDCQGHFTQHFPAPRPGT